MSHPLAAAITFGTALAIAIGGFIFLIEHDDEDIDPLLCVN